MQIKSLLLAFNQRPVAYYPIYAEITGCVTGGVVLSQLMYWWSAAGGRKFYKTDAELCTETRLSVKELATAKKAIAETGAVLITREGLPAKTYYEIDATALAELVEQVMPKRDNRTSAKVTTVYAESGQHSYTEITTENTTESTDAPAHFADAVKVSKGQPVVDFVPESLLEVEITEAAPKNCPTGDVVQPRTKMTGKQLQDLLQSDGSIQEANMDSISQTVTIVRTGPNNVKCVELIEITGPEPTKRKPSKTQRTKWLTPEEQFPAENNGPEGGWSARTSVEVFAEWFATQNHPELDPALIYADMQAWAVNRGSETVKKAGGYDWRLVPGSWMRRDEGQRVKWVRKATETVAAQVKMAQAAGYQPSLKEIAAAQYIEYQERNAAKKGGQYAD